jgi:hypothetical protein
MEQKDNSTNIHDAIFTTKSSKIHTDNQQISYFAISLGEKIL